MNGNDRVCGGFCDRICFYFKAVTNSVFSKDLGLSYKHESFTIDDSNGIRAGVCF